MTKYKILSIDAWGNQTDGYEWNQWYDVGSVETLPENDAEVIQLMIDEGFLTPTAKDLVYVDDDQYNLVITEKETDRPLYAIEYGNHE